MCKFVKKLLGVFFIVSYKSKIKVRFWHFSGSHKGDEKSSLLFFFNYKMNYINAIVHERPDKSLVYIAGKSRLDNYKLSERLRILTGEV